MARAKLFYETRGSALRAYERYAYDAARQIIAPPRFTMVAYATCQQERHAAMPPDAVCHADMRYATPPLLSFDADDDAADAARRHNDDMRMSATMLIIAHTPCHAAPYAAAGICALTQHAGDTLRCALLARLRRGVVAAASASRRHATPRARLRCHYAAPRAIFDTPARIRRVYAAARAAIIYAFVATGDAA